jgi:hypothetical protein
MNGGYYPDTKITDRDGDYLGIFDDGGILTHTVPENYLFYFHTIFDTPGVVAANTFMSVLNPVGSGKNVIFFQAEIASYSVGVTATANSLTANRISAASGGTLITAGNVNRFVTAWANPVAVVRVNNPTVTTVGLPLNAWVPPITDKAGAGATAYTSTPPGAGFVCLPGEGISFSTAAGDVDQVWKINVIWAEV